VARILHAAQRSARAVARALSRPFRNHVPFSTERARERDTLRCDLLAGEPGLECFEPAEPEARARIGLAPGVDAPLHPGADPVVRAAGEPHPALSALGLAQALDLTPVLEVVEDQLLAQVLEQVRPEPVVEATEPAQGAQDPAQLRLDPAGSCSRSVGGAGEGCGKRK
jgi:hypothetical protein